MQSLISEDICIQEIVPLKGQLLKWVGNKQRFAHEIALQFPLDYGSYFEPFLGSGAVLATLAPPRATASDCFAPLMGIWTTLKDTPETLVEWYTDRWKRMKSGDKVTVYEEIKESYNNCPNSADMLFLCRSCYGGVVRFRKADGYMSTPCGIHNPISPESFAIRVREWRERVKGVTFARVEYEEAMEIAKPGDLVYCDPPYSHSQAILYGAQDFSLENLLRVIERCKSRGVRVALSIDGTKKSGMMSCDLPIHDGLFEREVLVNCGRSMLKRFQMNGRSLKDEVVQDRLLLTY
jgi:DNA adenine methylase